MRTSPTISTTNTTASAPLTFFLNSSFSRGCPGKSTSVRDFVASPSGSVSGKVVEEGEMEVWVWGYESCTIWIVSFHPHSIERTLAKSDVLPPSTGPTSRTVAGPPLLVVLLPPVVTDISVCLGCSDSQNTIERINNNPRTAATTFGFCRRSLLSANREGFACGLLSSELN